MSNHLFVRTYAVGNLVDRLIAEIPVRDRTEAESIAALQRRVLGETLLNVYRVEVEPARNASAVLSLHSRTDAGADCCWAGEGCCS